MIENLDFALFAEPATDFCRQAATICRKRPSYAGADKSVHAKSPTKAMLFVSPPLPPWLATPLRHAKKVRTVAGRLKRLV